MTGALVEQGQLIRDYIFPIMNMQLSDGGVALTNFLGSGFFIGNRSLPLTAAHVLKGAGSPGIAMCAVDNSWTAFEIQEWEKHPEHDVAVLRIGTQEGRQWNSIVEGTVAETPTGSLRYHQWGYPDDVFWEIVENDRTVARPDLVFVEGHVRRRIRNVEIPRVSGSLFVELSTVAGPGCSGSPVFGKIPGRATFSLAGVYLGEKLNDRSTSVGYALPVDAFVDWEPALLGRTVGAEISTANPVA